MADKGRFKKILSISVTYDDGTTKNLERAGLATWVRSLWSSNIFLNSDIPLLEYPPELTSEVIPCGDRASLAFTVHGE